MDDYLAPGTSLVCKHMPSRKAALMDAGLRLAPSHRTAYIFLCVRVCVGHRAHYMAHTCLPGLPGLPGLCVM